MQRQEQPITTTSGVHEYVEETLPPIDPSVVHPSQMVSRPGPLLRLLGRLFFGKVTFPPEVYKVIEEAHSKGEVVFVLHSKSYLDYFYLNYVFLSVGLPLVFFANGINNLFLMTIKDLFKWIWFSMLGRHKKLSEEEIIRYAVTRKLPITIFLKKPKTLLQWGGDYSEEYLKILVEIQKEIKTHILLLPTILVWHPTPSTHKKSILDWVFGDPESPGAIRKFISFVRNFRRSSLQIGHVLDLKGLIEITDQPSPENVAARIKFMMHEEFRRASKAIRGPLLKKRPEIVQEILKNQAFVERLKQVAPPDMDEQSLLKRAKKILWKMAADFSINYIEGLALFLVPFWAKLFEGIRVDRSGLQRIREAARDAPIVILPSHRSHADYLLISSMFYFNGLIAPHIASGDNLNFWPVGKIFRGCGAFFIRRRFKGDEVYTAVAYEYIRKLIKEGYWIEFFIEGTRSRTGKMVAPRTGMLAMICKAVATGASKDVWLLPSSITYERVIEGQSYTKEAMGREKKKEGFTDVLKTAKVLKTRYGRVYLEFDPPVSCAGFMRKAGIEFPIEREDELDPKMVKRLAYYIAYRIHKTIVVTPQNIVAFVLLTHPGRGIGTDLLKRRVGFVTDFISKRERRLSDLILKPLAEVGLAPGPEEIDAAQPRRMFIDEEFSAHADALGSILHSAIETALKTFKAEDAIKIKEYSDEQIIAPITEKRLLLDIYKNGIINEFVPEAILSAGYMALYQNARVSEADLKEESRFLSRLFKLEFIYNPMWSFDELFESTVKSMAKETIFVRDHGMLGLSHGSEDVLNYFAGIIGNFIESYLTLFEQVRQINEPTPTKELLKKTMEEAKKQFDKSEILLRESISMNYYKTAILWLENEGICDRSEDRARRVSVKDMDRLNHLIDRLKLYRERIVLSKK